MTSQTYRDFETLAPTCRTAAAALRDGLNAIFGDDLAAIWVYGSAVFSQPAHDLDVHVILRRSPAAAEAEAESLRALHARIETVAGLDSIDGWYILLADARSVAPPANVGPSNPGLVDAHWALHRAHWLAGAVVVVHGLAPDNVVQPPSREELRDTLRAELAAAGKASPSAYWTLQLCRLLASAETGDVVRSKIDSGLWAIARLEPDSQIVVAAAIASYEGAADVEDRRLIETGFAGLRDEVLPLATKALRRP